MNAVCMTGRMTRDPEVKTTQAGVSVCNFTIAVDRNRQKSGQPRVSDFVSVVAWRNDADFIVKYFHKGDMIAVVGELQSRKYTAKDGTERTAWEVHADNVGFCGGKNNGSVTIESDLPVQPSVDKCDSGTGTIGLTFTALNADYEEITTDDDPPF